MTMTLSGTDGATFPSGDSQKDAALGNGQTWQNVLGSRTAGTTYTNTTDKPIFVAISCQNTSTLAYGIVLTVDGIVVSSPSNVLSSTGYRLSVTTIIPPGSSYSVALTEAILSHWVELRD